MVPFNESTVEVAAHVWLAKGWDALLPNLVSVSVRVYHEWIRRKEAS